MIWIYLLFFHLQCYFQSFIFPFQINFHIIIKLLIFFSSYHSQRYIQIDQLLVLTHIFPIPPSMKQKQLSYYDFSTQFKIIRHETNSHLGPHMLMRNTITKRRVIVKTHEFGSEAEIQLILSDYDKLCQMYNQTINICQFIGFCYFEQKGKNSMYLIYDYHQNTLLQEIESMQIKGQKFSQREIDLFIMNMLSALETLEKFGLNYLCLNYSNVLVTGRNSIEQSYSLLFTPYLVGAVALINQCQHQNLQSFNLSEQQLDLLNIEDKSKCESFLNFQQKLRSDKQSLGLMALRMSSVGEQKHKIYKMDENFNLTWDIDKLKYQIYLLDKDHGKELQKKIQYLLFNRSFLTFKQIPKFLSIRISTSNQSSNKKHSKSLDKKSINKYRDRSISPKKKFNSKKKNDELSYEKPQIKIKNQMYEISCNLSKNNKDNLTHSKFSQQSFSPKPFTLQTIESPTKQKKQKYQKLRNELENTIKPKIQKQYLESRRIEDDGSEYYGMIKNNQKDGYGIMYFKEGDIYGGEWKNNVMQGSGIYLFKNCEFYTGNIEKGLKSGQGKYIYNQGNWYEGEWKNDKKDGYGTMYSLDKSQFYEGHWVNGVKEGNGIYKWKNGDSFEGHYQRGLKNGIGIGHKFDGTKIQGQWTNDTLNGIVNIHYKSGTVFTGEMKIIDLKLWLQGKGTLISSDGGKYDGDFMMGKQSGLCRISFANGDVYEGHIANNKFEGEGRYYYCNLNCVYQGFWKAGIQSGMGQIQFNNGTIFNGQWNQGKPSSKAKIKYQNGDLYQGQVNRYGRHGKGVYYFSNGEKVNGVFCNGALVEQKA